MSLIINHVAQCRYRATGHSDEAKRVSDTVSLHWIAGGWPVIGKWMGFKLQDGQSDNMLYPSKFEAMRHQKGNYLYYLYVAHAGGNMTVCEAELLIALHRKARARDMFRPDLDAPNGGPDLIPRLGIRERNQQLDDLGG